MISLGEPARPAADPSTPPNPLAYYDVRPVQPLSLPVDRWRSITHRWYFGFLIFGIVLSLGSPY